MSISRMLAMMMLGMMLSGCAIGSQSKTLERLESQLSLLDRRVGQLERSGLTTPSPSAFDDPLLDLLDTEEVIRVGTESMAPPPPPVEPAKTVTRKKSSKPASRDIQEALKNAGFYQGTIDGKIGPMTREAVREFQRVHGLKDDGVVGKKTWAKLSAYTDLSADATELSSSAIIK